MGNVEIRHLRKVYSSRERTVEAIGDVSMRIGTGEFVCIVGPSGAGKTTLLRCMAGLLAPTSGVVSIDGRPISSPPKDMAVVFQEYGRSLLPWKTARQNIELPLLVQRIPRDERLRRVDDALAAVGLEAIGGAYPWQLSGGMQQRIAIARAVAYQPKVMVLDEPFAAVDAQTRAELEDLMLRLWSARGMTVIFVTHDIDEAVYLGQRVIVLTASPTRVLDDIAVDLAGPRDQVTTRAAPRFIQLRTQVYEHVLSAKSKRVDAPAA